MQTFVPYADLVKSCGSLDKKRCFKQVVETKQILCILRAKNLPEDWQQTKSYTNQPFFNHPAVRMWKGYEEFLKQYYNVFLEYCINVHKIKTDLPFLFCFKNPEKPFWWGEEKIHRSHRARLIVKDFEFYLHKFIDDDGYNYGHYWWPNMETKEFYIIENKEYVKRDCNTGIK